MMSWPLIVAFAICAAVPAHAQSATLSQAGQLLELLKPAGLPVATALLGFLGAWAGSRFADSRKWRRERKTVRVAFIAEMRALLANIKRRGLEDYYKDTLSQLERGLDVQLPLINFYEDGQTLWPVFSKLMEKVGALAAQDAQDIVSFYGNIRALRAMSAHWATGIHNGLGPAQKADLVRKELEIFKETKDRLRHLTGDPCVPCRAQRLPR